jgi:CheY-like chemotaxis protein
VLDVMLADMDGWELLASLTNHPQASSIPVIVCSVVRGEDLAPALGAVSYLPKPVRPLQFIEALDQAVNQAAIAT